MKPFYWCLSLMLAAVGAGAQTATPIYFSMKECTGANADRAITVTPLDGPKGFYGTNIVHGTPFTFASTNGQGRTNLIIGNYRFTFKSSSSALTVFWPADTNITNAADSRIQRDGIVNFFVTPFDTNQITRTVLGVVGYDPDQDAFTNGLAVASGGLSVNGANPLNLPGLGYGGAGGSNFVGVNIQSGDLVGMWNGQSLTNLQSTNIAPGILTDQTLRFNAGSGGLISNTGSGLLLQSSSGNLTIGGSGVSSSGPFSAASLAGTISGTNLIANSVSSNALDAATRALLGGYSGSIASNAFYPTNNPAGFVASNNFAAAASGAIGDLATNKRTAELDLGGLVATNPIFAGSIGATNIGGTNLDNISFVATRIALQSGGAFSNVNRYAWRNTLSAIQQRKNWTSLAVMDGLSSINIIGPSAFNFPTNLCPISGCVFGEPFPYWYGNNYTGSAAQGAVQTGLVPANYSILSDINGAVTYSGNVTNPAADYGIVWFLREPDAATFSIATNLNAGALVEVSGLSLVNASNTAGSVAYADFVEWTNPSPAKMTIVITNRTSGHQVKILGAGFKNRSITNGFYIAVWNGNASCGWSNILGTNLSVVGPIMSKINPTLILDEHITWEPADPGGSESYWQKWLDVIATNCPNADHVLCGTFPANPELLTATNNLRMMTNAILRGLPFFDGFSPLVDLATMTNRGFTAAANPDHPVPAGVAAYNQLLWNWLDLASSVPVTPGTRPKAFDPADVPSMLTRYDFNTASNQNGALISAPVRDLSGNQHDLIPQAPLSATYWSNNPAMINGLGFVQLTAANYLDASNFRSNVVVAATNTVFVVCKLGTQGTVFDSTDCAKENALLLLGAGQPDLYQGTHQSLGGYDGSQFAIFEASFAASANSTLKVNGVRQITGNAGSQTMNGLRIGAACDGTTKWDGGLAYFLMFNRGLTPGEEGNVTGWLASRFGIPLVNNDVVINTNFVYGLSYTNGYAGPITVIANAILTSASVAGDASVSLWIYGSATNIASAQTISGTTATTNSVPLMGFVPAGAGYVFTNSPTTGSGDASTIRGGQILRY